MAVKKIVNIPDAKPPMILKGKNNNLKVILEKQSINIKGTNYECRLISVTKIEEIPSKWINKVECFNWLYKFKVFSCNFNYVLITIDYDDNIIKTESI
jgi:hypothetical protein